MPARGGRLSSLDLIRGIAILGILPVHILIFGGPGFAEKPDPASIPAAEKAIAILVMMVLEGKMVTLLSILFGVGLAIQADHARAAGQPFAPYYGRRMGVLFCFGVLHALLLFALDILTSYAVVGLMALFLLGKSDRTRKWVCVLNLAWCYGSLTLLALLIMASAPASGSPPPPLPPSVQPIEGYFSAESEIRIFRDGTLGQMIVFRAISASLLAIFFWLESAWYLLACVLIGIALVRQGVFHQPSAHRPFLRKLMIFGLILCLPFQVAAVMGYLNDPNEIYMFWTIMGGLPLALAYLAWIVSWAESRRLPWLQARLREVGRMALTNYLLQSLLCGFIFYSYGLRLFDSISVVSAYLFVIGIWLFLMLTSWLWLRRFQLGPVEWLWRRLAGKES